MARQGIFTGFTPNDGLGDSLASGAVKVNANFTEIYNTFGDGTNLSVNAGSAGTWSKVGSSGIVTSKNVGIGTTIPTAQLHVSGNTLLSGITTGTFVGDGSGLTGVTAVGQGVVIKDSGTLVGVAQSLNLDQNLTVTQVFGGNVTVSAADTVGYAHKAGVATLSDYSTIAGLATNATTAGTATTATTALSADFATIAGIVTYASAAGLATEAGNATYSTTAGISSYTPIAGVSTLSGYATTTGIATVAQNLTGTPSITIDNINSAIGIVTFPGQGSKMRFDFDATGDLPTSTSWRGMFAYANNTKRAYVSTGTTQGGYNGWRQLLHQDEYGNYFTVGVVTASKFAGDGSLLTNLPGADSLWRQNSTGINTLGKVGIGTTTCTDALNVLGNINLDGRMNGTSTDNRLPFLWATYNDLVVSGANALHGQFAHVHETEKAYYAHAGNWVKLVNHELDTTVGTGTENYRVGVLTATTIYGDISNASGLPPAGYASTAGIATVAQGLTGTPNITVAQVTAANVSSSGVVTATSFVGDGSGLTGVTASGTGIIVKDSGTLVGTIGTIDFGSNLSVSAASAGVVTVTGAAGGGGGIDGISTTGTSTFNDLVATQLNVSGLSTLTGNISVGGSIFVPDNKKLFFGAGNDLSLWHDGSNSHIQDTGTGSLIFDCNSGLAMRWGGSTKLEVSSGGLIITGVVTATKFIGDGSGLSNLGTAAVINVEDGGSTIGAAGTINFGSNLTVSPLSAGIVTVTGAAGGGGGSGVWETTGAGINTVSNVGIATTNPLTKLQVGAVYGQDVGEGSWTAIAGIGQTVDAITLSANPVKSAEYHVHIENGSDIQSEKVLVMNNGTTAYSNEFAVMYESDLIVSIGATITSGELRLVLTPESGVTGVTTYRFVRGGLI
jgi:hypothetical protein